MKEYKLVRLRDGYVSSVYIQVERPEHNYAFGLPEEFELQERTLSQEEVIQYQTGQVRAAISDRIAFGQDLMVNFSAENIMLGITVEQAQILLSKIAPLQALLSIGAIETAISALESIETDEILTVERIIEYSNKMRSFLGLPDTEYQGMSQLASLGSGLRDVAAKAAQVAWPVAAGAAGSALLKILT